MRQTFDKSVPLIVQRIRVAGMKQVGRKHNHTKGPTRSHEAKDAAKIELQKKTAKLKKFRAKVAAYWRGESDSYPKELP